MILIYFIKLKNVKNYKIYAYSDISIYKMTYFEI